MKRRDFLRGCVGAAVAAVVPKWAKSEPVVRKTYRDGFPHGAFYFNAVSKPLPYGTRLYFDGRDVSEETTEAELSEGWATFIVPGDPWLLRKPGRLELRNAQKFGGGVVLSFQKSV